MARHLESPEDVRALIAGGRRDPAWFRATLTNISPNARDAWVDRVLGLDDLPEDGPALPRGCVPYLPCSIDALLRVAKHAPVHASDVFVDIGSGMGRAAAVMHLLTGASVLGLEVQPALVAGARELARRLRLTALSFVHGDAAELTDTLGAGSVFLLYCPFSGDRLAALLAGLETVARSRAIRICCVDLPLPVCAWLERVPPCWQDVVIHRAVFPPAGATGLR
jgi:SAM-dependent methyltransferase